ncbi:unnamed protein product [Adineta ricciae]|uniref:Uncharacterized protein n=1 Tax=Adineta ricciae TaxID=249248 RepID=A0A815XYW5_ADIRI|nr:unnamed protein product [Adineta ricciae]
MKLKGLAIWIYRKGLNYNLFMLENHEYDDDEAEDNIRNPAIILKHQKYKTWLYVTLLTVCLYITFYGTLISIASKTVTVSNVTLEIFEQLSLKYNQTLLCPCSTIILPFQNFISFNITMHPVCQSKFLTRQWIESLYFENASQYGVWDFRTTAYSQFELLSRFCSQSNEIISQIQLDINNTELVTLYLLSKKQIEIKIDGIVEYLRNSSSSRMITFLNYLRNTIQTRYFISALNTNLVFSTQFRTDHFTRLLAYHVTQSGNNKLQSCSKDRLFINATLSPKSHELINATRRSDLEPLPNSTIVNGFYAGCTPLEVLLSSTLHCLYQASCLQLLFDYFPLLQQINFKPNHSILSSTYEERSVYEYLTDLFIVNWSTQMNYTEYSHQCSSISCSYSTTARTKITVAITLFISLYGGLIIILRLVASFLINLININDRTEESIKHQKIITRLYIILLGSTLILCLFISLSNEIVIIRQTNPLLTTYNTLKNLYSSTLQCPCLNKAIANRNFLVLSPNLHQICSSGFIHEDWIRIVQASLKYNILNDWLEQTPSQFQLLSDFCYLANKTIENAMHEYLSQLFIVSSVINETEFHEQINASLRQFYQTSFHSFHLMINISQLLMQIDQHYVRYIRDRMSSVVDDIVPNMITNQTLVNKSNQLQFLLNGIKENNADETLCFCATNPSCQTQTVLHISIFDPDTHKGSEKNYNVTGWIRRCHDIDSLLLSTLQCLYDDSDCFPLLISHVAKIYQTFKDRSSSLIIYPLIYNSNFTRFPPNTTVFDMFKEVMIEQWNPSSSYQLFYQSCAPIYCAYFQQISKYDFFGVIVKLISMIGGIVASLRIITPHLVEFIFKLKKLFQKKEQNQEIQEQRVHPNCIDRIKKAMRELMKSLLKSLVQLNIFSLRDLGSNTDRLTAQHHGRWATRLYILLFLSSFIILVFYTIIQPFTITKIIDEPEFSFYKRLEETYGNKLKCSCSRIASVYNDYVEITPKFHPICSSEFISDEWRIRLTNGLVSNLSIYSTSDYRRYLPAHLQYLQRLCLIFNESVHQTVNDFLTSLLVTTELLTKENFHNRLNTLIDQSESKVSILFSRFLSMIQTITHGNAFMSTYGTNFQHSYLLDVSKKTYAYSEGIIYDDNCSCSLFINCTTQATFIFNQSTIISIRGLKIGCLPSESFHLSTLECFYDQVCLNLLYQYTNQYDYSIPFLNISDYFPPNTTINELISHSFIEQWIRKANYPSYYHLCLPSLCFYTYHTKFNVLYIITLFLSLQGGLTIVLKWICPKLIRIVLKFYSYQKRQTRLVYPTIPSNDNQTSKQILTLPNQCYLKFISIIISLIFLVVTVFIFSRFYSENVLSKIQTIDERSNTTLTTTNIMLVASSSIFSELPCQSKFEQISLKIVCSESEVRSFVISISDLNNDNQVDLVYICEFKQNQKMFILLGNGNGTFHEPNIFLFQTLKFLMHIHVEDFNKDNRSDILITHKISNECAFTILYSIENGSLQTYTKLLNFKSTKLSEIVVFDVNNDTFLDILVILPNDPNINIFYGKSNGNFSSKVKLFVYLIGTLQRLMIGDVNNDQYVDLIVYNTKSAHIHVFFGNANKTFEKRVIFFTAIDVQYSYLVINDFNNDNQSEIGFVYSWNDLTCMIYQYDNKSFNLFGKFVRKSIETSNFVLVHDINGDNHLDIIFDLRKPDRIYGLFGLGNGQFYSQLVLFGEISYSPKWLSIADFNNDHYQDIISVSKEEMSIDIFLNKHKCPLV